jgi:hypothetical protein
MSARLDELARTLAQPMSRRRALRLAAGALVAASVPGMSPRPALAGRTRTGACDQGYFECKCPSANGLFFRACCPKNIPGKQYVCECFADRAQCTAKGCPPGSQACGEDCCEPYEICEGGKCVCPERCGSKCCDEGSKCENPKKSLCCTPNWKVCVAGSAGAVKCCPPNETCCMKFGTTKANCCGKQQTCDENTATCRCKAKGETPCGSECCKKSEKCMTVRPAGIERKQCCPNDSKVCGWKATGSSGKTYSTCCKPTDVCCDGQCCPKGKRCLYSDPTFKPNSPNDDEDLSVLVPRPNRGRCGTCAIPCGASDCCGKGYVCKRGRCVHLNFG